ncbi:Cytidine/deoxycytidylate deaminase family protein [[Clostridium] ultunense Esp]|uniref:Cytidine/deoxycytidylate deaminase family protein n=1 Tax=[Clostridium] ultunense Esp TaxID=1288971 RepID=M1Z5V5_9FIRM|nr:cytidine/deoxycytidylate deaminase family protein [Schnuerera ultunensis]CCQ92953.1 Cytidine/deoxycytidylate deaminase family protein [[Clostridium] ultunense Esp]SHD78429.1 Cytidine/deoxycytidylate deaminase family protein [[Clostridium] ultunense Esp]
MGKRKTWNEYFMQIAEIVATRSTCDRAEVGCLIVNDDNRIVSTGYNGSISGNPHCDDVGHTMRDGHCIATIHAEMNALLYCAKEGISVKDCKIYVTHFPCLNCTKALIQAGIKKFFYKHSYRIDDYAIELLKKNNVSFERI